LGKRVKSQSDNPGGDEILASRDSGDQTKEEGISKQDRRLEKGNDIAFKRWVLIVGSVRGEMEQTFEKLEPKEKSRCFSSLHTREVNQVGEGGGTRWPLMRRLNCKKKEGVKKRKVRFKESRVAWV